MASATKTGVLSPPTRTSGGFRSIEAARETLRRRLRSAEGFAREIRSEAEGGD
jgi:hypothetical protein